MAEYETERIDCSLHEVVVAGHAERLIAEGYEFFQQVGRYAIWRRRLASRVEEDNR